MLDNLLLFMPPYRPFNVLFVSCSLLLSFRYFSFLFLKFLLVACVDLILSYTTVDLFSKLYIYIAKATIRISGHVLIPANNRKHCSYTPECYMMNFASSLHFVFWEG